MMNAARLIASGFGCGFARPAPGTVASALALLPGVALLEFAPQLLPVVAFLVVVAGIWAIHAARVDDDPGWVVIDEIAGQLLALCGLVHASVLGVALASLIFRLLDVSKPGPIGWADQQAGAVGIMADDVLGGAIVAGILWAMNARLPALFS